MGFNSAFKGLNDPVLNVLKMQMGEKYRFVFSAKMWNQAETPYIQAALTL